MSDPTDRQLLKRLGAAASAFLGRFPQLREIQRRSIQPILEGRNALISASTASGKTEAALAPLIGRILSAPRSGKGIRLLIITPTRSLVNDLYHRLEVPLAELNWTCGRQTSDHRNRDSQPHVLITTPESFDSTLVNGFINDESLKTVSHLLAKVEAVFLDEGHLFFGNPRGEQILFLLQRLRKLRSWAVGKKAAESDAIQVVSASATLFAPESFADLFLGSNAAIVSVSEPRRIQILLGNETWRDVAELADGARLCSSISEFSRRNELADVILEQRRKNDLHKFLIFARSRSECDHVAASLRKVLAPEIASWFGSHHASLSAAQREESERRFATERDAVLIATTTLEVGVDIGDVDVVVLTSPPANTAALLQRIGRGNRKSRDVSRVVCLANSWLAAAAFAGELITATVGSNGVTRLPRFWSVFAQQSFSLILQGRSKGRSRKRLEEMAVETRAGANVIKRAQEFVSGMVTAGMLRERKNALFLGESVEELTEMSAGVIYANFDGQFGGISIQDAVSGQILGTVSKIEGSEGRLNFAGQSYSIDNICEGVVEVRPERQGRQNDQQATPRYAAKRMPVLREFCDSVRTGCGLGFNEAPVISRDRVLVWFHFGGEVFERMVHALYPEGMFGDPVMKGIAIECHSSLEKLKAQQPDLTSVRLAIRRNWESLATVVEKGRFFSYLPDSMKQVAVADLVPAEDWHEWLGNRSIAAITPDRSLELLSLKKLMKSSW